MAIIYTPQILCQHVLETTGSDVYVANNKTVIKEFCFVNYSASPIGVDIYLIPSAATMGPEHALEKALMLDPGKSTRINLNTVMPINSRLHAVASDADSVALCASGVDVTII